MGDFMLLTILVTHNLNIINDISTRRLGYCYFVDVISAHFEKPKVWCCICFGGLVVVFFFA